MSPKAPQTISEKRRDDAVARDAAAVTQPILARADRAHRTDRAQHRASGVLEPRAAAANRMEALLETAEREHRDLTEREAYEYDVQAAVADSLTARVLEVEAEAKVKAAAAWSEIQGGGRGAYAKGQPLADGQTMAGYVQARRLGPEDHELDGVGFGDFVLGVATGQWDVSPDVRNAMTVGTQTAGGHLVPAPLAGRVIDRARAMTRVLQAGALIVPMESATLKMARVAGDPSAAWHSEMATIAASDMTFDAVTFTAQSLASRVQVSRELWEDAPNLNEVLEEAFAAQFALTVDRAALYGSGTAPEPRGVKNVAAVTKTPLGANGATPTWDALIDSAYRVKGQNFDPGAFIYAPRTGQTLAKAKDSQLRYLDPPAALDGITRYETNQVPVDLTVGTSTDTSDVFTGVWPELLIGVRTELVLQVLTERSADVGAFEILAWWRGDVQVARPAAFDVVTGARP